MFHTEMQKNIRFNFIINTLDAAFFGFGILGVASNYTILPLFLDHMTDSTMLISLIAAIRVIGWHVPQLLTVSHVARVKRYKPMTLMMTIHERWPFLGLALVALLIPTVGREWGLILTFLMVSWHSLGGGLTSTPWQSMIAKIIPPNRRGTFFGIQSGTANMLSGVGAVIAGLLLKDVAFPLNFALCFFIASLFAAISWAFLSQAREPENTFGSPQRSQGDFWRQIKTIIQSDTNLRWFLVARTLVHFAWMPLNLYTIYAVRRFTMDEVTAGMVMGVLLLAQTIANPVIGWVGDRWGHRRIFAIGGLTMAISAALAFAAPNITWFYLVFGLAGIVNAIFWTSMLAMTAEFGSEHDRPFYIGLTNTLIAPAALIAPLLGGWLADVIGFEVAFVIAAVSGFLMALVLQFIMRDPRPVTLRAVEQPVPAFSPAGD